MTTTPNTYRHILAGLISAVLLSGCTFGHPPASNMPTHSDLAPGEVVTVQPNQTIYGVAQAHNVAMRDLIAINNLKPPFAVQAGQHLTLPISGSGGPTQLGGPTNSYGSSAVTAAGGAGTSFAGAASQSGGSTAVETQELSPVTTAPASGSQVDALNRPAPVVKSVPTTANALSTTTGSDGTSTANSESSSTAGAMAAAVTAGPAAAGTAVASGDSATDASAVTPGAAPTFIWPVQGPIVSSFGSKGQGLSNDGINISAPKGSPVVAAAGGTVAYAGNDMKGFGNLILIRHADGWVTAYAHLERVLVSKDAVVASGDMIGTVGKTGSVQTTQLHFETRHNSKAVDPTTVIAKP